MPELRQHRARASNGNVQGSRTRSISSAIAAAALPAVLLSGMGAAAPAMAADVPSLTSVLLPKEATQANVTAAQNRITSHLVASHVPSRVTVAAAPSNVVVRNGDTLSHIALRHDVSLATLLRANNLKPTSVIHPGQRIKLGTPAARATPGSRTSGSSYTVKPGDTLSGIAHAHRLSLSAVLKSSGLDASSVIQPGQKIKLGRSAASAAPKAPAAKPAGATGRHTVAAGDTLSGIAAQHGLGLSTLLKANGLSATSVIRPGQKLSLGAGSSVAATSSGNRKQLVPSTFLHYRYPASTVKSANANKHELLSRQLPSTGEMKGIITSAARQLGVDPSLALAHAYQESGFNMAAVSPANAIGAMQVIPTSGDWASQLVGRPLDLLNPYDNATAGVAIIAALQRTSSSVEHGIASYYQGQGSVKRNGMYNDTKRYVGNVLKHQKSFR